MVSHSQTEKSFFSSIGEIGFHLCVWSGLVLLDVPTPLRPTLWHSKSKTKENVLFISEIIKEQIWKVFENESLKWSMNIGNFSLTKGGGWWANRTVWKMLEWKLNWCLWSVENEFIMNSRSSPWNGFEFRTRNSGLRAFHIFIWNETVFFFFYWRPFCER